MTTLSAGLPSLRQFEVPWELRLRPTHRHHIAGSPSSFDCPPGPNLSVLISAIPALTNGHETTPLPAGGPVGWEERVDSYS